MSDQTVKGHRKPNTAGSDYNSQQFMIQQAIRAQVNTAIPVKVQAVSGLYVDVLPLVANVDGFGQTVDPTTIFHLPFFRYHAGSAAVIVDPVPGDIGLAVFAKADCSNVTEGTTDPQQPGSFRRFSQSDGFYIGGCLNGAPSVYIEVTQDGVVNINASTVNISGDAVIGGISFLGHVHGGVQSGGSTTSTPQ